MMFTFGVDLIGRDELTGPCELVPGFVTIGSKEAQQEGAEEGRAIR